MGTEAAIVHVQYWHDVECMVLCLSYSTVTCLIAVAFFHYFFVFHLLSMFCILLLLVVKKKNKKTSNVCKVVLNLLAFYFPGE